MSKPVTSSINKFANMNAHSHPQHQGLYSNVQPKLERRSAPPPYRPQQIGHPSTPVQAKMITAGRVEGRPAPPVYKPQQMRQPSTAQPKFSSTRSLETRPAPPVYRPQPSVSSTQLKGNNLRASAVAMPMNRQPKANLAGAPKANNPRFILPAAQSKKQPGEPYLPANAVQRRRIGLFNQAEIQMKTAIFTLTKSDVDDIGVIDDDLMIRQMEADLVVESNAATLKQKTGGEIHEINPADSQIPADLIRGVDKLYIVGHGSGNKIAGVEPRKLARNLYSGIFEHLKEQTGPDEDVYEKLKPELILQEIYLVACLSAETRQSADPYAKEFFSYVSNLPKEYKRPMKVVGLAGYGIVDYNGNLRAIPSDRWDEYKTKKKLIKTGNKRSQHMDLLDEMAPLGKGIKTYAYDPVSLNF